MRLPLLLLLAAGPVGALDVIYFHMWKFRSTREPQSVHSGSARPRHASCAGPLVIRRCSGRPPSPTAMRSGRRTPRPRQSSPAPAGRGSGPQGAVQSQSVPAWRSLPRDRFRLSSISTFYSGVPASILVGSADLNSDGINGDLLPGTRRGSLGREITDRRGPERRHPLVQPFVGGNAEPARTTAALPRRDAGRHPLRGLVHLGGHCDCQYMLRLGGRMKVEATAQMFNASTSRTWSVQRGCRRRRYSGVLPMLSAAACGVHPRQQRQRQGCCGQPGPGRHDATAQRQPDHHDLRQLRRGAAVPADRNRTAARGSIRVEVQFLDDAHTSRLPGRRRLSSRS